MAHTKATSRDDDTKTNNRSRASVPRKPKPKSKNGVSCTNIKKIKKFVRCSKKCHLSLRTTTNVDGKLEIVIQKGAVPSDELLYIKQESQYQVRYNDQRDKSQVLLAIIPKHYQMGFNFSSIASFTQYIVNHKFIRFRNRGPTQTKHVSLWRIYKFEGEQTLFNIWVVTKAAEKALGLNTSKYHPHIHVKKKNKNYHLSAIQPQVQRIDSLGEDVVQHIFSYVNGSKWHCWVHVHEVIDRAHHRSNLVGLEFDSNTRKVFVMQRSPSLLKKIRQIGDKYFTQKHGGTSVLTESFFKKSVEMFKAVY
eukprot:1105643_1